MTGLREWVAQLLFVDDAAEGDESWDEISDALKSSYMRDADRLLSLLPAPAEPHKIIWEHAAQIAERDSVGVTLADISQFSVVQATGARIAFNIRAAALKVEAL